jgi:hypothetical protein
MKTLILAAFAVLSLGVGVVAAEPATHTAPQQSGSQYNWIADGPGWG